MASLVVDASVALALCFGDEATPWTKALLERAQRGDQIVVPAHWSLEISNSYCLPSAGSAYRLNDQPFS